MSIIENGKVEIDVHGKKIEIEIRNGKFVKPKELLQVVGRGSALKPAHEPVAMFSKGEGILCQNMLRSFTPQRYPPRNATTGVSSFIGWQTIMEIRSLFLLKNMKD